MLNWIIPSVLIVWGVMWLTRCIDQAGNLILRRLDELEEKIDGEPKEVQ
jgi:hypothetical protein